MSRVPIIITGMHRSGTSLLAHFIEKFGVFLGNCKENNYEAIFSQTINNWLLSQANATWDNIYNLKFSSSAFEAAQLLAIDYFIKCPERQMFLGQQRMANCFSLRVLDEDWGWKDPRNILFIDLWMRTFPEARIINIYRNPVDVADSLRRRKIKYDESVWPMLSAGNIETYIKNAGSFRMSMRIGDMYEGIKLWEDYAQCSISAEERYPDNMFSIHYEDLLANPGKVLTQVADSLDIQVADSILDDCCDQVKSDRCYAFKAQEELCSIYREVRGNPVITRLGYGDLLKQG